MKTETKTGLIDREGWPEGPWDHEPDRQAWTDPDTGLPCLILRNRMGAWCGYVAVPPGHPWHGLTYWDLDPDPQVHGGITYTEPCSEDKDHICHTPEPDEPDDVWWVGFDCLHFMDLAPRMIALDAQLGTSITRFEHVSYKTMDYAITEVTSLARQAKEAA